METLSQTTASRSVLCVVTDAKPRYARPDFFPVLIEKGCDLCTAKIRRRAESPFREAKCFDIKFYWAKLCFANVFYLKIAG